MIPLCAPGDDCAILFARTPISGRVKSRLWTHLTPEQACALHCAAASDMAALLAEALPGIPHWLFFSEEPAACPEPALSPAEGSEVEGRNRRELVERAEIGSAALVLPPDWQYAVQQGTTLGDRMAAAFLRAFASGARRVVIFGSDSPTLPPRVPQQALEVLADCDVVLGPSEDGGYYLIGCRRFDPRLFHGVEWSTPRTCEQTLANARSLGFRTTLLERWFDLDEWKDIERLLADARRGVSLPRHLAAFLKKLEIPG